MLKRAPALVATGLLLLATGCGAADRAAVPPPAASQLADRDPRLRRIDPPSPADFAAPIAAYRRHVSRELAAMSAAIARLRAALAHDDLAGARTAWLAAMTRYETIGAAYGAFGPRDTAINGRPGGLPGGVRSARFTGLHRVEVALWARRSTRDARRPADRLAQDVARLRAAMPVTRIAPLDYALRSHEILEDALHLQLSGVASPWSGTALAALRSNVTGTRLVLRTLRGLIRPRDTTGALEASGRALQRLQRALRDLAGPGGRLPRWPGLPLRTRERIDALTAGAAEQLAVLPELLDPRPPRRAKSPFG